VGCVRFVMRVDVLFLLLSTVQAGIDISQKAEEVGRVLVGKEMVCQMCDEGSCVVSVPLLSKERHYPKSQEGGGRRGPD
jgi:hypothetical protein